MATLDKTTAYATVSSGGSTFYLQNNIYFDASGNQLVAPLFPTPAPQGDVINLAILKELQMINLQLFAILNEGVSSSHPNDMRAESSLTL